MSKFLIDQLGNFEHYNYDKYSKNITNNNMLDSNVSEFLEIIHLLDSEFVDYNILNNFSITILGKR